MSEREQIIPMRGMPVAQAEESEADGYEGRGRFLTGRRSWEQARSRLVLKKLIVSTSSQRCSDRE